MNYTLVDLPTEILWEIVGHIAVAQQDRIRMPSLPAAPEHPVAPLRRYVTSLCLEDPSVSLIRSSRTCKRLANICVPTLFHTIKYTEQRGQIVHLLDYLVITGRFVKHLKLECDWADRRTLLEIVKRCSNLRSLTVINYGHMLDSPDLPAAIMLLPDLTELRLMGPMDHSNSIHRSTMLEQLLGSHGDKLRSLTISGLARLGKAFFASLSRDARRLVELEFRDIGILPRSLPESTTWACAGHLQSLTFIRCDRLYANVFTKMLASGVFGHPQKVSLSDFDTYQGVRKLSDWDPDDILPRPPAHREWTIPTLDTLEFDFLATWEMESLQLVHTKKVFLSRVTETREKIIQQLAHKTSFPELVELHVTTDWNDQDFIELQRVCSARGVRKIMRDWPLACLGR